MASNGDIASTAQRRNPTRPPGAVAVAVSLVVVVWLSLDVLHHGWWVAVDMHTSTLVRGIGIRQTFWPKVGVYAFTQLGARGTILVLFTPFVVILAWRRQTWQPLIRFAVALLLLTATVYGFKYGVGRAAPPLQQIHAEGRSFPSGHAPNSVLMWGLLAWLAAQYDLPHRIRQITALLRYTAPVLTCLAMLLLDYHWLSDLVAGFAVGIVLLRVLHLIFDGRLGHWGDGQRARVSDGRGDHHRGVAVPDVGATR
ncbi:MAG TPA: phosphatase PAP2 family protein [Mycobacteriales bacterium]|nr:phosphatase PAP2 family protein [Mycobacteriales bacterium]